MPGNKKPRKKYKPAPSRLVNPIDYVKESLALLCEHDPSYVMNIKLKDHSCMTALAHGQATRADLDVLAASHNLVFGMYATMDMPDELRAELSELLRDAGCAFDALIARGRYVCRAGELAALNTLVERHDNLLDVVTVSQWDKALSYATARAKKVACVVEV